MGQLRFFTYKAWNGLGGGERREPGTVHCAVVVEGALDAVGLSWW